MRTVDAARRGGATAASVALRRHMGNLLSAPALLRLVQWTAVAALVEFLLLRVVIRLGPMLPPQPAVLRAADGVILLGTTAMNVAALLSLIALSLLAYWQPSRPLRAGLVAAVALTLARLAAGGDERVFLLYTGIALAVMLGTLASPSLPPRQRGLLAVLLAVYGALAYPVAAASAARLGWHWPAAPGMAFVAEGLAVGFGWLAFLVCRPRRSRGSIVTALALTVIALGFWLARPWLALTFSQWTVGFTGFLPIGFYFVALGLFTVTVVGLGQARQVAAWGLLLVALAGLRWDYSYLSGLGLLGFLALAQPWQTPADAHAEGR